MINVLKCLRSSSSRPDVVRWRGNDTITSVAPTWGGRNPTSGGVHEIARMAFKADASGPFTTSTLRSPTVDAEVQP